MFIVNFGKGDQIIAACSCDEAVVPFELVFEPCSNITNDMDHLADLRVPDTGNPKPPVGREEWRRVKDEVNITSHVLELRIL